MPYWLNSAAVQLIASMMAADPNFPLDFSAWVRLGFPVRNANGLEHQFRHLRATGEVLVGLRLLGYTNRDDVGWLPFDDENGMRQILANVRARLGANFNQATWALTRAQLPAPQPGWNPPRPPFGTVAAPAPAPAGTGSGTNLAVAPPVAPAPSRRLLVTLHYRPPGPAAAAPATSTDHNDNPPAGPASAPVRGAPEGNGYKGNQQPSTSGTERRKGGPREANDSNEEFPTSSCRPAKKHNRDPDDHDSDQEVYRPKRSRSRQSL